MLDKILLNSIFLLFAVIIISCGDDTTTPGTQVPPSDITRTGKFIAFTSNQNLNYDVWLAQVDASGNLVTTGLVYATNPVNLTSSWTQTDKQPNWSPDGKVLVFSRTDGTSHEIYAFFFKADGSIDSSVTPIPKKLFSSSGNWDENPFFSPDGKYLIWDRRIDINSPGGVDTADPRDIYRGSISGTGNNLVITNNTALTQTSGPDEYNAKWSPKISVQRILYEYAGSATSNDHDVFVMDPLNPVNNQNYYNPGRSGYPAWEPACTRVIFECDQGNSGLYQILSAPYPTGSPYSIVSDPQLSLRYPTWFPNSGLIAYIRIPATNIGNIYIISSTGGTSKKLLPSNFDSSDNLWPAW